MIYITISIFSLAAMIVSSMGSSEIAWILVATMGAHAVIAIGKEDGS